MTFEEFERDRQARQLVAHNFEIIGEAMNRLRRAEPTVVARISNPNQYIALRNVPIHRNDVIDYSILWNVVQQTCLNSNAKSTRCSRRTFNGRSVVSIRACVSWTMTPQIRG
jgi:uncharacterized protein with HEPN domain